MDEKTDASSLITSIVAQAIELDNRRKPRWYQKISDDITWDVSGLIGIIVTIVLMFMIVSRTFENVPREILAGWTTILGFHFGKATKS
jgi:hypothetical protein